LTLREAAGLAGLSFSFWGQVERGDKAVTNRRTLEAMASALRVHPAELAGRPWTPADPVGADAQAGLDAIETVLEYELGTDPGLPVRAWPQIATDLERLVKLRHWASDFAAIGELAPGLIRELHGAYVHLPHQRPEVLVSLMKAYHTVMSTAHYLGGRGLPALAARAAQRCAETLDDPVWLGYAAWLRGATTGHLDRDAQYRRSVAAAETLTSQLNDQDAVQACGMLHLSAALAAGVQADHATAATHLDEASALAARMDTEVGTWAHLWFGLTNVGIWRTSIALDVGGFLTNNPTAPLRAGQIRRPAAVEITFGHQAHHHTDERATTAAHRTIPGGAMRTSPPPALDPAAVVRGVMASAARWASVVLSRAQFRSSRARR
jgi:transcriptional regulator with XRE-family HTH domain